MDDEMDRMQSLVISQIESRRQSVALAERRGFERGFFVGEMVGENGAGVTASDAYIAIYRNDKNFYQGPVEETEK